MYKELLGNVDKLLDARDDAGAPASIAKLKGRVYAACQVFWPSKRFTDAELIPGGGAASAKKANNKALSRILEDLKKEPARLGGKEKPAARAKRIDRALKTIDRLEDDAKARKVFVEELREVIKAGRSKNEIDDGSAAFFKISPETMFKELSKPVVAPRGKAAGGAMAVGEAGGATGLSDLLEGAQAAARRIANFVTYYEMKDRAGTVGEKGVAAALKKCRAAKPNLRIHLVGHSFGGRAAAAAGKGLDANSQGVTLSLLQAAFSHNALSADFGEGKPGFYRSVVSDKRVTGPIIITHTKDDRAVGIAYPLASRLARQVAAAVGDENDPYGGMGRNGAQRTQEAKNNAGKLGAVGHTYTFESGKIYNLLADGVIKDHGDVRSGPVAYAILACSSAI